MCIATHCAAVRLACVKHAASVQSEPGSNSSLLSIPDPKQLSAYSITFIKHQRLRSLSLIDLSAHTLCLDCLRFFKEQPEKFYVFLKSFLRKGASLKLSFL